MSAPTSEAEITNPKTPIEAWLECIAECQRQIKAAEDTIRKSKSRAAIACAACRWKQIEVGEIGEG